MYKNKIYVTTTLTNISSMFVSVVHIRCIIIYDVISMYIYAHKYILMLKEIHLFNDIFQVCEVKEN